MKSELFILMTAVSLAASAATTYPGTIHDWIVSGPWPNYKTDAGGKGLDTDFLDFEADAVPYPGKAQKSEFIADKAKLIAGIGSVNEWGFTETKTFDATWKTLTSSRDIVSLDHRFDPIDDWFVTYAACYVDVPEEMDARLAVGSDDDHKVYLNLTEVGKAPSSQGVIPGNFKYDVRLPKGINRILLKVVDRTKECGFTLAITDRKDQAIPGLQVFTDPRGKKLVIEALQAAQRTPEKLTAANAALEKRIAAAQAKLPVLERQAAELKAEVETARQQLKDSYRIAERKFAVERARSAERAPKSVDEALEPAPESLRSRLCLNGEWAASVDRTNWVTRVLPRRLHGKYFIASHLPVEPVKKDEIYGAYKVLPGYDDFKWGEDLVAKKAWFRTTFRHDGKGRKTFTVSGVNGALEVFCNGTSCGTYEGRIGKVQFPLENVKTGENTLELLLQQPWFLPHQGTVGIRGDLFLEATDEVRVADVWVRPSWRKARLGAEIALVNDRESAVKAEIRTYAVKDGRVRLRLPSVAQDLPAKGRAVVKASSGWADPVLWGIGGIYGDPELYDFVTDVVVDGKVVDRHLQRFGFREFWTYHTDFFLNGRRIIIQGDTGEPNICRGRWQDVYWPLLRADGINLLRYHDSDYWSESAAEGADRMGMLCYVQMYPLLHAVGWKAKNAQDIDVSPEEWTKTKEHAWNLQNYRRWFRLFRNHPSVVIWSTDNEIFTQAWDTPEKLAFNIRNDKVGALYEKYMKQLDPGLIMTRDGDIGTWGRSGRWHEDPPCDTANYHYPDFNVKTQVIDWQRIYDWRPALFGETLYCSYGAWNAWIGAIPSQVQKKADRVREVVPVYRDLEVAGQVYMGLGYDGFIIRDNSGKGNPKGITWSEMEQWKKDHTQPKGQAPDQFPWFRIAWPALSGLGERPIAEHCMDIAYGQSAINVYDDRYPSHIRNAVNEAYRDSLLPQPPLRVGSDAEVVVVTAPNGDVWGVGPDGRRQGVRADRNGRAWFRFLDPGTWTFTDGTSERRTELGPRGEQVMKPGFPGVGELTLRKE